MAYDKLRIIFGAERIPDVLVLLDEQGPLRFTELESNLSISSETLTRALSTLEENNLVTRHDLDSRAVEYRITDRGSGCLELADELEERLNS